MSIARLVGLHEDIILELSKQYGANAVHAYWLPQLDDISTDEDLIDLIKLELNGDPTEQALQFLRLLADGANHISEAEEYFRQALAICYPNNPDYMRGDEETSDGQ